MSTWQIWLSKTGALSDKETEEVKAIQEKEGYGFGETLLKEKIVDKNSYLKILVTESPYPLATPGILQNVAPEITNIISQNIVQHFICYPLAAFGSRLQVAFLDPTDLLAIRVASISSGMEIEPFCCHSDDLIDAIHKTFKISFPIFDEQI